MRVPVFNQQINEAQTPSVQISGGLTPEQAVGAVSNQLDGLTGLVDTGAQIYNQYQDTANKARVSQVTADYQNRVNNYLYNPKDGLLTIKGENALNRDSGKNLVNEAFEWFDSNAREQEGSLSNGTQRQMFNKNMATLKGQLGRIASQHLFNESQKFQKQAFESEIDANISSVSMSYSDLETTSQSLEKIRSTAQNYGQDLGWGEQQIEQYTKDQQDKAVFDAVSLMQNNGDRARIPRYFQLNRTFFSADSQSKITKLIQDNQADSLDQQMIILKEKGDAKSLGDIADDLQNKKGSLVGIIGERNITASLGRALSYRNQVVQKTETDQVRKNNDAETSINDFKQAVLEQVPLSGALIDRTETATKGTSSESDFLFWRNNLKNFQTFQSLKTSEQLRAIQQMEVGRAKTPSNDPKTEGQLLKAYKEMYQAKLKNIQENPSIEAQKIGYQVPQIQASEMLSNPKRFMAGIIETGKIHAAMSQNDGNTKIKPVGDEILPEVKQNFERLNVDQKLNFIGGLVKQTQNVTGGKTIWQEAVKQIGGDQRYVKAGVARMKGFKSTDGRDLAASIITGTQILKNDQFLMPKENDLKALFNAYVGQTVTGKTANDSYEVFKAVYADTLVARGQFHNEADELPKTDIAQTALEFGLGGVYDQSGSFNNYRNERYKSWKVTKPYSMTDDVFEAKVDKGYKAISQQTGISVSDLKNFRLKQTKPNKETGEIQYDLLNERGNPLIIKNAVWRIKMTGVTK